MEDFGGRKKHNESTGRGRNLLKSALILLILATLIAGIANLCSSSDTSSDSPDDVDKKTDKDAFKQTPSLDPDKLSSKLYPSSPWERRNNLLNEAVKILESPIPSYQKREQVLEFVLSVEPALTASCAELQGLIQTEPSRWAGVSIQGEKIRQLMVKRVDVAFEAFEKDDLGRLKGLKAMFLCK
jgi:hypothetical protein